MIHQPLDVSLVSAGGAPRRAGHSVEAQRAPLSWRMASVGWNNQGLMAERGCGHLEKGTGSAGKTMAANKEEGDPALE